MAFSMRFRLAVAALCLPRVHAYASVMTSSDCATSLAAGEDIMSGAATSSTARSVSFEDASGTAVACGSEYTAGSSYTAQLSSTSGSAQYVIEISGGTFDRWDLTSGRGA